MPAIFGRERYCAAARRVATGRLFAAGSAIVRNNLVRSPPVPPRALVSDHVFRALLEAVLAGRYAPEEKLPTQRALAADLGVTMGSLREALKRLEQMGLVDVRHGDAMRVRDWREHGGLDVIAHLLFSSGGLDAGVLGDVLEARRLMLRELAALAALRASEPQKARLHDLAEAFAGWKKSPPHRANMLNRNVDRIGIAVAYNKDSKFKDFWCLVLARPDERKVAAGPLPGPAAR